MGPVDVQAQINEAVREQGRAVQDTQIDNIFTYHKPFGNQAERYGFIRAAAKSLALVMRDACPESREKALALTNLQQSVMWANASIAINETETASDPNGMVWPRI